jgi:hypothetical protein
MAANADDGNGINWFKIEITGPVIGRAIEGPESSVTGLFDIVFLAELGR